VTDYREAFQRQRARAERLAAELAAARATNTRLHRRTQAAESALSEWREMDVPNLRGGSLGRKVLAWGAMKLTEERDALRAAAESALESIDLMSASMPESICRDGALGYFVGVRQELRAALKGGQG